MSNNIFIAALVAVIVVWMAGVVRMDTTSSLGVLELGPRARSVPLWDLEG
jgi:hypothetical protein